MTAAEPLAFLGNPSSPYTRKMLALLRYRRIEHRVIWGSHMARNEGLVQPKASCCRRSIFRPLTAALKR